jgi:hypothetical protein
VDPNADTYTLNEENGKGRRLGGGREQKRRRKRTEEGKSIV